ncbi:hypothetical protein BOX15_Mlig020315g1 [Macrostomum lignano]|uniref:VWFA domain-containing protein n=2 Tax=Macrostomum lignano TaxID=282301 RepID=A0A267DWD7_9PLAT|nr:hypothetical protein BOX15_Mlig020315g1 [Macrostomum lignano]
MAVRTGFLLLALCLIIGIGRAARPRLNISDIDLWVTTISKDLTKFRRAVLGADSLETSYKASGVSSGAVKDTQASLLLQTVKNRIQALMWRSEKQVERIRGRAEELFAGHSARNFSCSAFTSQPYSRATAVVKLDPASPTPAPSGVDYCNQIATLDLRPDPRLFDAETDRNTSTSQVAQFVYHASNEILNVANWTDGLEDVMKQNATDDQTVQWQYFGSKQGLMKIYPGVQWFPQNLGTAEKGLAMDPFDCRNQNWYLMSETYPKDLVLVIDNSGSMMGSGSIMANRTMTEFFATLTANDYFNVLLAMGTQTTSASYVRYVTDVYNGTLLQATDANKNKMMELLNEDRAKLMASSRNLQAQGLADLGGALTEAFQLLRLVKENKTAVSAGGVQAIALVTDSTPEDYAAVFAKFNPDRQVRLFTYLMGQEARDAPVVKSMACANRGYFGQVSTMSDAKATVLHYLPVMARPNSKSQDRFFTWSDVHQNQIPTVGMSDNAKRALFTSVSQAAYDLRRNSTVNAGVIGVAGADLAMNQFDQLGPAWELGPLAYIFIVNNNGFVIYHPELRTIDSSGNPLLFYSSRDIASIEVPADSVPVFNEPDYNLTLRTALVQRQTGTFDFARIRLYNGNSRSQRITYRYLTTPLLSSEVAGSNSSRQTPFSLGLALPWQSGQQWPLPLAYTANASNVGANLASAEIGALLSTCLLPVVSTGNLSACQPALSLGVGLSSNFEFCDFSESLRVAFSANPVCAAAQALAMNQTAQAGMSCSAQFLSRLRVDAAASLDSPNIWRAAFAANSSTEPARLLGATGGYTFLWCGGSGLARWLVDPALNGSLSMPRWQNGTRISCTSARLPWLRTNRR